MNRSLILRLGLLFAFCALVPVFYTQMGFMGYSTTITTIHAVVRPALDPDIAGQDPLILHAFADQRLSSNASLACIPAGDINGDGTDDLWLLSGEEDGLGGALSAFSGRDGTPLRQWRLQQLEGSPILLLPGGDMNGDGEQELVVCYATLPRDDGSISYGMSMPGEESVTFSGYEVIDGATGEILRQMGYPAREELNTFGAIVQLPAGGKQAARLLTAVDGELRSLALAVGHQSQIFSSTAGGKNITLADAGDVDGDGLRDLFVGKAGAVQLLSGADSQRIAEWQGSADEKKAGRVLACSLSDLDGDGRPEVLLGHPGYSAVKESAGRLRVLSGADGSELYHIDGSEALESLGSALANVGDVNGDGHADFAAGAPFKNLALHGIVMPMSASSIHYMISTSGSGKTGRVRIYSGKDGSLLREITALDPGSLFGAQLRTIGDLNGDGFFDLAVQELLAERGSSRSRQVGTTWIFSGAELGKKSKTASSTLPIK